MVSCGGNFLQRHHQVTRFIQVSDDRVARFTDGIGSGAEAQLPFQVVGQARRLGQEILEGRLLDHFPVVGVNGQRILEEEGFERTLFDRILFRGARRGVEVFLEVAAKIHLLERVVLVAVPIVRVSRRHAGPFLFGLRGHLVERGDAFRQLFEDGIGDHLLVDHLAQLELVEREHTDHLHQARCQNLLLSHPEVQSQPCLRSATHQIASWKFSPR